MFTRIPGWLTLALGMMILSGCCFAVREQVDHTVCEQLLAHPLDEHASKIAETKKAAPADAEPKDDGELKKTGFEQEKDEGRQRTLQERLKTPADLPGADAPPIRLPPAEQKPERDAAIEKLYPALPVIGEDMKPAPGPEGKPLTLADLQKLAMTNSPVVRQASADVESAKGTAMQAGLYPNPTWGFEQDTAGTAGGAGYIGAFVEQTIMTGGKLKLAVAIAAMDLLNAQVNLRRTQADVMADVRSGYFAVLVASQNMRVSRALARFTEEIYRIQVDQVKGAQSAAYEPMQLRVLAMQARSNLVQARNRYTAAWKQLAATLGLPAMPPAELAGSLDMPIPLYHYDRVLAQVLGVHTDVASAENSIRKARYNLRLAQVTPVPDVSVRMMLQKDYTSPPFEAAPSVAVSVPVPVFDRNQGNIVASQSGLVRANEESHRVRTDLTGKLAEAFEHYENNRIILDYYRTLMLPDQVRAYQGVYMRHQQEPDKVTFGDVVNAQQTLASTITSYLSALSAQWEAVVDVAHLMQSDDLYQGADGQTQCVAAVPDLELLLSLPCCHPCSPLPNPALKGGHGAWPDASAPSSMPREMNGAPRKPALEPDKKTETSVPNRPALLQTMECAPKRESQPVVPGEPPPLPAHLKTWTIGDEHDEDPTPVSPEKEGSKKLGTTPVPKSSKEPADDSEPDIQEEDDPPAAG